MKKIISAIIFAVLLFSLSPIVYAQDSAKASVVINGDTGEVLYQKNAEERLAFASTTKIMTALLLCEKFPDLESVIRVSENAVNTEGTKLGLKAGDTIKAYYLLYGMMLPSGNDAANAAAEAVSGSIESFVSLMNRRAHEMGLKNTHFDTPSGLDGKSHYTTALDLARLTRIALQNEEFKKAAATKSITLNFGENDTAHYLKNHNRLLFMYDDVIGVKTGFTKRAGRCLVSAAQRDGKYVIAVTLNDKNDFSDHRALLDKGYSLLGTKKRVKAVKDCVLPLAGGGSLTLCLPQYNYFALRDINISEKIYLPRFLYRPVKKGEELGEIEYFADYKFAKKFSIKADKDIPAEEYTKKERFFTYLRMIIRI